MGRIADHVARTCGIRLDDGRYEAGTLVGESRCPGWPAVGSPITNNRFPYLLDTSASNYFSNRFWHGSYARPGFIAVPEDGRVAFRGEYLRAPVSPSSGARLSEQSRQAGNGGEGPFEIREVAITQHGFVTLTASCSATTFRSSAFL